MPAVTGDTASGLSLGGGPPFPAHAADRGAGRGRAPGRAADPVARPSGRGARGGGGGHRGRADLAHPGRRRAPDPAAPRAGAARGHRAARRRSPAAVPLDPGVRIRRAGAADLDAVVWLGMETIRYDAHFGTVIERPGTPGALSHEAARVLAAPDPWVWLAERDGTAIALLYAERPEFAAWIAPVVQAE